MTDFTQTDTTGGCAIGVYCTGASGHQTSNPVREASEGGAAGTTAATVTESASNSGIVGAMFQIIDGTNNLEDLDGATGDWIFRLNVDKANMNLTWTGVGACRVSSGCVNQETICDDQTISQGLGSTGVLSQTVNQSSAITMGSTDIILCPYAFDNSDTMMEQTFDLLPDQNISNQWSPPGTTHEESITLPSAVSLSQDEDLVADQAITLSSAMSLASAIDLTFEQSIALSVAARLDAVEDVSKEIAISLGVAVAVAVANDATLEESLALTAAIDLDQANDIVAEHSIALNAAIDAAITEEVVTPSSEKASYRPTLRPRRRH